MDSRNLAAFNPKGLKLYIMGVSYFRGNPIREVFADVISANNWKGQSIHKHIHLVYAKSKEAIEKGFFYRYESNII